MSSLLISKEGVGDSSKKFEAIDAQDEVPSIAQQNIDRVIDGGAILVNERGREKSLKQSLKRNI